jgi:hypothetical protein
MKKIFTLLFVVGFLTAANAQSGSWNDQRGNNNGYNNGRDVVVNNDRYDNDNRFHNGNGSYSRGLEMQIARINHKYDFMVQRVQNNFFMRRSEKARVICSLEEQRQQEIKMLCAGSDNRYGQHDRGYNSNRHY